MDYSTDATCAVTHRTETIEEKPNLTTVDKFYLEVAKTRSRTPRLMLRRLDMAIEPRMIVGGAAAFALVGGVLWGSALVMSSGPEKVTSGTVEISMDERAWMVEVHDLAPASSDNNNRTAANR